MLKCKCFTLLLINTCIGLKLFFQWHTSLGIKSRLLSESWPQPHHVCLADNGFAVLPCFKEKSGNSFFFFKVRELSGNCKILWKFESIDKCQGILKIQDSCQISDWIQGHPLTC